MELPVRAPRDGTVEAVHCQGRGSGAAGCTARSRSSSTELQLASIVARPASRPAPSSGREISPHFDSGRALTVSKSPSSSPKDRDGRRCRSAHRSAAPLLALRRTWSRSPRPRDERRWSVAEIPGGRAPGQPPTVADLETRDAAVSRRERERGGSACRGYSPASGCPFSRRRHPRTWLGRAIAEVADRDVEASRARATTRDPRPGRPLRRSPVCRSACRGRLVPTRGTRAHGARDFERRDTSAIDVPAALTVVRRRGDRRSLSPGVRALATCRSAQLGVSRRPRRATRRRSSTASRHRARLGSSTSGTSSGSRRRSNRRRPHLVPMLTSADSF